VQDDKPAVYHGEGEALVGRSVVKKFKRTKYSGQVIGFDPECKWYKVCYLSTPEVQSTVFSFNSANLMN
jgi:hypothetical protein